MNKLCFVSHGEIFTILKFGPENDETKEFLQKVVFIFEKLKFSMNYYLSLFRDNSEKRKPLANPLQKGVLTH
jgi:hypothetical protein